MRRCATVESRGCAMAGWVTSIRIAVTERAGETRMCRAWPEGSGRVNAIMLTLSRPLKHTSCDVDRYGNDVGTGAGAVLGLRNRVTRMASGVR
jgi:hypothetical protein